MRKFLRKWVTFAIFDFLPNMFFFLIYCHLTSQFFFALRQLETPKMGLKFTKNGCFFCFLFCITWTVNSSVIHIKLTTPTFKVQKEQREIWNSHRNIQKRTESDFQYSLLILKNVPKNWVFWRYSSFPWSKKMFLPVEKMRQKCKKADLYVVLYTFGDTKKLVFIPVEK